MEKPKTYLDRSVQAQQNYYFVSYSHADKDAVYSVLRGLYDKGANFWYDSELCAGDFWDEKVASKLNDPYCSGVLWFISADSLKSDAVYQEIKLYSKRYNANPAFKLLPVSLKSKKIIDYFKDYAQPTDELFNRMHFFVEVTRNSAMIFESYKDSEQTADSLYSHFQKSGSAQQYSLNLRDCGLEKLDNFYKRSGEFFLDIGDYDTDVIFDADKSSKDPHIIKDTLTWKLINVAENMYYFICCRCIDFATLTSLDLKLGQLEDEIKEQLPCVESVGLVPSSIIENYRQVLGVNITTDYADYRRLQPLLLFWAQAENGGKVFYNIKNIRINRDNLDINAGIRPMLVINGSKVPGGNIV